MERAVPRLPARLSGMTRLALDGTGLWRASQGRLAGRLPGLLLVLAVSGTAKGLDRMRRMHWVEGYSRVRISALKEDI